ncbi:MAG: CinA family protein [Acidimicrobiales bacterium]
MRCEVVAIGTELLLGQIVDTNSSWIGEQLALAGIDSHFQTKVGDNLDRMVAVLEAALERSDAVIVCGGLGPTQDDITRDAIARVMGVERELDDDVAARTAHKISSPADGGEQPPPGRGAGGRNRDRRPATRHRPRPHRAGGRQGRLRRARGALRDEGDRGRGDPSRPRAAGGHRLHHRQPHPADLGESESGLAERLAGRVAVLDGTGNPTLAYLASGIEGIKVRLTAKGATTAEAEALLAEEEAEVRRARRHRVRCRRRDHGARRAGAAARPWPDLGRGRVPHWRHDRVRICDVPGASDVFRGSIVAYASDVKRSVLGVPDGLVVSAAAATAMAAGARRVLGTDVGVAVTGVAGPDPRRARTWGPCGSGSTSGRSVATPGPEAFDVKLPGNRLQIRQFSVITALSALRARILALG